MANIPVNNEAWVIADTILKESGAGKKDISNSDYYKMIGAIQSGDFNISIQQDAAGKFKVGVSSDAPENGITKNGKEESSCPEWMPALLCPGYGRIVENMPKSGSTFSIASAAARYVGADELADKIEQYGVRISVVVLSLIVIGVGLWFVMQGNVKGVVKEVVSAVK